MDGSPEYRRLFNSYEFICLPKKVVVVVHFWKMIGDG